MSIAAALKSRRVYGNRRQPEQRHESTSFFGGSTREPAPLLRRPDKEPPQDEPADSAGQESESGRAPRIVRFAENASRRLVTSSERSQELQRKMEDRKDERASVPIGQSSFYPGRPDRAQEVFEENFTEEERKAINEFKPAEVPPALTRSELREAGLAEYMEPDDMIEKSLRDGIRNAVELRNAVESVDDDALRDFQKSLDVGSSEIDAARVVVDKISASDSNPFEKMMEMASEGALFLIRENQANIEWRESDPASDRIQISGVDPFALSHRRSALYRDRIMKQAQKHELSPEETFTFRLMCNLNTMAPPEHQTGFDGSGIDDVVLQSSFVERVTTDRAKKIVKGMALAVALVFGSGKNMKSISKESAAKHAKNIASALKDSQFPYTGKEVQDICRKFEHLATPVIVASMALFCSVSHAPYVQQIAAWYFGGECKSTMIVQAFLASHGCSAWSKVPHTQVRMALLETIFRMSHPGILLPGSKAEQKLRTHVNNNSLAAADAVAMACFEVMNPVDSRLKMMSKNRATMDKTKVFVAAKNAFEDYFKARRHDTLIDNMRTDELLQLGGEAAIGQQLLNLADWMGIDRTSATRTKTATEKEYNDFLQKCSEKADKIYSGNMPPDE